MKPHLWVGLCVLGLTLVTPAMAANVSVPAPVAEKPAVASPDLTSPDLTKDQWDDWDESFDDDWVDRRDGNGDRDRNDRDRFEDDDFFNGVDDERGRDQNDVRDDYGNDWDRNRDRDRDDDDDDDDYWSGDRDRDEDHRCPRNGCQDDYYDRNWDDNDDDDWQNNNGIQFRLQENNNQVLPFILRILQQL